MNKMDFLKQVKRQVAILKRNKRDPRYVRAIGFLVAKGFLHTNRAVPKAPNIRINIEDAIWAGKNVEPRILEVLPAAVMRLENHFNYNPEVHVELNRAMKQLRENGDGEFFGVPIDKIRPWLNIRLKDKRTKTHAERKVIKTFRLSPSTVERLKDLKTKMKMSETELLEQLVAGTLTLDF